MYGQENEENAVRKYLHYMNNSNRHVTIFKAGCVMNPNFPWMVASPDRIIYEEDTGFG